MSKLQLETGNLRCGSGQVNVGFHEVRAFAWI